MQKMLLCVVLFVVSMLMSLDGHARAAVPMQSPQHADFVVSGNRIPGIEKVRESIVVAASARGWQVISEQAGQQLQLRNVIRGKHTVVVDVFYDTKGVRIDYVSSENLKYTMRDGAASIHPKYNEWVKLLLQDIVARVSI